MKCFKNSKLVFFDRKMKIWFEKRRRLILRASVTVAAVPVNNFLENQILQRPRKLTKNPSHFQFFGAFSALFFYRHVLRRYSTLQSFYRSRLSHFFFCREIIILK